MKKLFLFFFSFLIINISNGQVNFGLKSGINIATTRNIIAFPKIDWDGMLEGLLQYQ
ncbi:MAG: hypothetical protein ACXWCZ_06910 [Flavisolibacter sp.]